MAVDFAVVFCSTPAPATFVQLLASVNDLFSFSDWLNCHWDTETSTLSIIAYILLTWVTRNLSAVYVIAD